MNRWLSIVWRILAPGVLLAVLSACGGGGGGGGGDSAGGGNNNPPSTADAANSYLPTDPAIVWIYNIGAGMQFLPASSSNGQVRHALNYNSTGGREYFTTSADQIGLHGLYLPLINVGDGVNYTGDINFNSILPLLRSDWSGSGSLSLNGSGTIDISPTYGRRDVKYIAAVNYTDGIPIKTPYGLFQARIASVSMVLTTTVQGQEFQIPYNVTFWFVKGLGIVRREQEGIVFTLTSIMGMDGDKDTFLDPLDLYPNDGNRWEVAPLYASDDGIALTSVPSYSRLSQTVTIMTGNGPAPMAWNALSDQGWLTVTPGANSSLQIVANPVGLAPDTLHYANVTVSSGSDEVNGDPARIRVALWVGSQDASVSASLPISSTLAVADPLRPYVYVNNVSTIDIYNIYTQALVHSITLGGAVLNGTEQLSVSSDGSSLFLSASSAITRVDLDAPYTEHNGPTTWAEGIAYARPQGHSLIVDSTNRLFESDTGELIPDQYWRSTSMNQVPVVSVQGNHLCGAGGTINPAWVSCQALSVSQSPVFSLHSSDIGVRTPLTDAYQIAISNSGDRLYATESSGALIGVYKLDAAAYMGIGVQFDRYLSAARVPDFVAVDADDTIYSGLASYNADFSVRRSIALNALPQQFWVSGDSSVLLHIDTGNLVFTRNY